MNLFNNWQDHLLTAIIVFGIALGLHFILFRILLYLSRKSDNNLEKSMYTRFRIPALLFLVSIALSVSLSLYTETEILVYVNHAVNLVIIFSISLLITRFISLGKDLVLKRYNFETKDNLKARKVFTQFKILERILVTVIVIITVAVMLMTFENIRKIGLSLFASAGVAGIILGFAAQKLIGNMLAGFQLAMAQPIRLDDVLIVEGEWGWVEEINLTYVVIRLWDKRRLVVPTTWFIEKPFQNWTRNSADILGTVFIYTDYSVPFDRLREELTRILESDKNWDRKVNNIQVTNSTEKTVEIRALMSSADSPSAWDLRVNVREKLITFLQENYPDCLPKTRLVLEKKD